MRLFHIFTGTVLALFLTVSFSSYGQVPEFKAKEVVFTKIKTLLKDTSWVISNSDSEIIFNLTDTMCFTHHLSVSRFPGIGKLDTITLVLSFKRGWSERRIRLQRNRNHRLIQPLAQKYIHYRDSLSWSAIKSSPQTFNESKVFYLQSWKELNEAEKDSLSKVERLPDMLFKGVGIFLSLSFRYKDLFIEQSDIHKKVRNLLTLISFDVLKSEELINGEPKYE